MTTEERVRQLEKQLEDMRLARDVVFVESIRKRVFQDIVSAGVINAAGSDLNETTNIGAGGGSVSHTEPYDQKVRVTIDGTDYYIGLYNV